MDATERELPISGGPGPVVLLGSGETSRSGRRVYDWLMSQLPQPIRVAILETPAGFQPNSALVAGKIGDFMSQHLRNYQPEISLVPARKHGTADSPDDEDVVLPVLQAGLIFLGPGSPTYAVRQLQDSLAWHTILSRYRQGSALVLASAAVIAVSKYALPVYEIYKAGDDLHWQSGLNLFGCYGLSLVFVSHWNNREGGIELDTKHCYMGQARFEQLRTMLPPGANIVGIDEHTALVIDTAAEICRVMGRGTVTLLTQNKEQCFESGQPFAIAELGAFRQSKPESGIPPNIWERVLTAQSEASAAKNKPSPEVLRLMRRRELARAGKDWNTADILREQIDSLGWQVNDTPNGPRLKQRS